VGGFNRYRDLCAAAADGYAGLAFDRARESAAA
jgi:hypothetical protein